MSVGKWLPQFQMKLLASYSG